MSLVSTGQINEADVFALLKLIADPSAAKKRLQELQQASVALDARDAELRASAIELNKKHIELTARERDADDAGLKLKAAADSLARDRAALEQHAEEVAHADENHRLMVSARAMDLEEKTDALERARVAAAKTASDAAAALSAREKNLSARELEVVKREKRVELAELAYARKAERLRKELSIDG